MISVKILKELKPEVIINTAAYVRVDDAEIDRVYDPESEKRRGN